MNLLPVIVTMQSDNEASAGVVLETLYGIAYSLLERLPFVMVGLVVFVLFWIIGRIIQRVIITAGERTRLDNTLANLLGRLATAFLIVLGALVAAVVIFPTFRPGDLVAGLGITSVAVGFAFKDVLQNFFAGILLLWRRPFVIGDQIRVKEFEGTVEDINVRSTRLKTYDGERAIIPNGDIYTSAVLVRTAYQQRRVKFVVGIGYLDDIELGRRTITAVLNKNKDVSKDPGPHIYVSELAPSSVNFTVYFWTNSRQAEVLRVSDQVATGIKYALDGQGIDMPYPHRVVILNDASAAQADRRNEVDAQYGTGAGR
jgi:small conductance mechanosensitive channel